MIRFQVMVWNVPDRKAFPWMRVAVAGLNLQLEQRDAAAQEVGGEDGAKAPLLFLYQ